MPIVSAGDVNLEYFEAGAGDPTVVLVHGATSSARIWHTVQELLAGAGIRSLALSMRGAGASDRADQRVDYRPDVYASDLAAALGELGVTRFVLVGHSLGVANVLYFMRDNAGDVDVQALVLVAGGAADQRPAVDAAILKETEEALKRAEKEDQGPQRAAWEPDHLGLPEDVRDALWTDIWNNPRDRVLGQRMTERPDMKPVLESMGNPTLVMSGDADDVVPLESTLKCFFKLPEDRRHLHVFHGVGHYPNGQVPTQMASVLQKFVTASVPA